MADPKLLLGVCGLYCGACYHFQASFPENRHLLEDAARKGRDLLGFTCSGCRSSSLYIYAGCAECQLRACAERKQIQHCGLCDEYPCQQLIAFQNDGRVHHLDIQANIAELKELGADRWLAEQELRWKCKCGTSYSLYEKTCHNCGENLNSYRESYTEIEL